MITLSINLVFTLRRVTHVLTKNCITPHQLFHCYVNFQILKVFCKLTIIQITSLNQTQKNISFSNRNTSICLSAKSDCLDHIDVRVAFFPHFTQEFHRKKGFGVDRHKLPIPAVARYIRFYPTKHRFWVHLRVEVYGIFKGELITSKHDK